MRILQLHNFYQQPGGEDMVVQQEGSLLESKGHEVRLLADHNRSISGFGKRAEAAVGTVYSRKSKARVQAEIHSFRPDLVHIHNWFPLLSPSVYYACESAEVPVVQTLHNFRLVCVNGLLFREGHPCESCLGKTIPWPGVAHACYRDSRLGSAIVASMQLTHRLWGTWERSVDAYIVLTNFAKQKLASGGLPAERMFVKPNFVFPDPGRQRQTAGFALFVGRLTQEKGVGTLISAWDRIAKGRSLKIIGMGPLQQTVQRAAGRGIGVEYLGQQPNKAVLDLMGSASFLVFPSEWYEGFPLVIVEAFARGLPVLGSRIGSVAELVEHRRTGVLFRPGQAEDLANHMEWMFSHPKELQQMSTAARCEFDEQYSASHNYQQLLAIYDYASAARAHRVS